VGAINKKAKKCMPTNTDHNAQTKALPLWCFDNKQIKLRKKTHSQNGSSATNNKARSLAKKITI
jgi:hypothetical protein